MLSLIKLRIVVLIWYQVILLIVGCLMLDPKRSDVILNQKVWQFYNGVRKFFKLLYYSLDFVIRKCFSFLTNSLFDNQISFPLSFLIVFKLPILFISRLSAFGYNIFIKMLIILSSFPCYGFSPLLQLFLLYLLQRLYKTLSINIPRIFVLHL